MSHYYTNDENLDTKVYEFKYTYKTQELKFLSTSGVFSKSGIDFGSNLLINSLPNFGNKTLLDVGCGAGVIGLTIASGNPTSNVDLIDVNKRAVDASMQNQALNKIKNAYCFESDLFNNVTKKYDAIITNPPIRAGKKVIYTLVDESIKYLKEGGSIYLVIQKKQGALSMEVKLNEVFGNVETINKKNGYYIFESKKCTK